MKFNVSYKTSSGTRLNVHMEVKKLTRKQLQVYLMKTRQERDDTYKNTINVRHYNTKPCCPPQVALFNEFPTKQYFYVVIGTIYYGEFMVSYPKCQAVQEHRKSYLFTGTARKISKSIVNRIVALFPDSQAFRTGGCLGCKYKNTQRCNTFMPSLEAVGVRIEQLTKDHFEHLEYPKNQRILSSIGGFYTDENLSKDQLMSIIQGGSNYEINQIF